MVRQRSHGILLSMFRACVGLGSILVISALSGCTSSSSGGHPGAGAATSATTCPSPDAVVAIPAGPPARLPHPQAVSAKTVPIDVKGDHEVQFTTAMPLRDAAAFVQTKYPKAGYAITGGDAEKDEADIVWAHNGAAGKTRLSAVGGCSTLWTVLTLPKGAGAPD